MGALPSAPTCTCNAVARPPVAHPRTRARTHTHAGTKVPNGVLLGQAPGGSMLYVEPPGAVALNNELGAARAEAQAAEESVLWQLTGLVMGSLEELQQAFKVRACVRTRAPCV